MSKEDIEQLPVSIEPHEDEFTYDAGDEARMPQIADIPRARRAILKAEANSLKHLLTHKPNNPYCEAYNRAKMYAKPRRAGSFQRELKGWG